MFHWAEQGFPTNLSPVLEVPPPPAPGTIPLLLTLQTGRKGPLKGREGGPTL